MASDGGEEMLVTFNGPSNNSTNAERPGLDPGTQQQSQDLCRPRFFRRQKPSTFKSRLKLRFSRDESEDAKAEETLRALREDVIGADASVNTPFGQRAL
eukprot:scaffold6357_cov248-Pinguiococcus_pyrenoidosus.AAC.3